MLVASLWLAMLIQRLCLIFAYCQTLFRLVILQLGTVSWLKPQMIPNASIEERLSAIEAAIAELQEKVADPPPANWLQQITGSFKDEPAFEEVFASGRAIRKGDETLLEAQDEL